MTKSQNTKNEQQKDLCITSEQLTEQWKKGELPNGYYWIRLSWGGMVIMAYHTAFDGLFELDDYYYDSDEISEVLAQVPSYEEWQAKLEENAQLKELLKECKRQFEEVELCRYDVADTDQEDWFKISTEQAGIANKMIAKIDEV